MDQCHRKARRSGEEFEMFIELGLQKEDDVFLRPQGSGTQ
jgi:hypothetical protein